MVRRLSLPVPFVRRKRLGRDEGLSGRPSDGIDLTIINIGNAQNAWTLCQLNTIRGDQYVFQNAGAQANIHSHGRTVPRSRLAGRFRSVLGQMTGSRRAGSCGG